MNRVLKVLLLTLVSVGVPPGIGPTVPAARAVAVPSPISSQRSAPLASPSPSAAAPAPARAPAPVTAAVAAPFALPISGAAPAPPGDQPAAVTGFVTRRGTRLFLNGQPYHFAGFNIYNANSRKNCAYTMAGTGQLDASLNYIGANRVFRAWYYQYLAQRGGVRDWSAFDQSLAVARAHGYHVILTLADQWGSCDTPGYKGLSWYQGGYRQPSDPAYALQSYRDYVRDVVMRYKNDPTILAWQLMNEAEDADYIGGPCQESDPSGPAPRALHDFAADVSGLIKSIDPNHLVSLGTLGGGDCGIQNVSYPYVHSVPTIDLCEYHDYGANEAPLPGGPWNGLQVRLNQCAALGKPLFVGEMGSKPNELGGFDGRAAWFDRRAHAQLAAGSVGEVAWAWMITGSTMADYDIGPGDPVLAVFSRL
jgi:hypothetical protein